MSGRVAPRHRAPPRASRGLLRRWWLILPLTFLGATAGYVVSGRMEPVYQASASILVGRSLDDPTVSQEDIETGMQLASTYADVARRQPILEATARELGLEITWQQLGEEVAAKISRDDSQVLVLTVNAPSSEEAVSIAAEIVEQIIAISPAGSGTTLAGPRLFLETRLQSIEENIARLERQNDILREQLASRAPPLAMRIRIRISANDALILDYEQSYASLVQLVEVSRVSNRLEVLEEPEAAPEPVWPDTPVNIAIGAATGFLLGLAIAMLLERRRPSPAVTAPITVPDAPADEPADEPNVGAAGDADPAREDEAGTVTTPSYDDGETALRFFYSAPHRNP